MPAGITLNVRGDANDYFGKGLSGGIVSVRPNESATYKFDEDVAAGQGNVAFFGATSGRGFINGLAAQRFAVRNSGATVVVEGCGNHGCEYMTGGCTLVLGEVGQNFAAGMTGGVAYVFDEYGTLASRCNQESVELKAPRPMPSSEQIRALIEEHVRYTASPRGIKLLYRFAALSRHFVKVIPTILGPVLQIVADAERAGKTHAQAEELAFEIVTRGAVAPAPAPTNMPACAMNQKGALVMGKPGAFLEHDRTAHVLRPVDERVRDFDELYVELDDDARRIQASRCMMCSVAFSRWAPRLARRAHRAARCITLSLSGMSWCIAGAGKRPRSAWRSQARCRSLRAACAQRFARPPCDLGSVDGEPTTIHDNERAISDHEWATGGPRRFEPADEDAPLVSVDPLRPCRYSGGGMGACAPWCSRACGRAR